VSPTATDVECDCTALVGEDLRDEVEILSCGVHGAVHIGAGAGGVLVQDN